MYDTSVRQTFSNLDTWRQEIDTYVTKQNAVRMLVGNKIDKVCLTCVDLIGIKSELHVHKVFNLLGYPLLIHL